MKDCFVISVPMEKLRFPTASSEGGPPSPSVQYLNSCIQDLANALVQCEAFKFEERILQFLGLEEKFDIDMPAAAFGVGSKVCKCPIQWLEMLCNGPARNTLPVALVLQLQQSYQIVTLVSVRN